jgi:hypothetical protein
VQHQASPAAARPSCQTLGAASNGSGEPFGVQRWSAQPMLLALRATAPLYAKQVQRSLRVPVARHVLSNVRLFLEHVHALARAARPASWRAASLRIMRVRNPRQSPACSGSTCSGTLRHMSRRQLSSSRPQAQGTGQSQAIETPAPNPSIERTANGGARSSASADALPPLSAAHVKRQARREESPCLQSTLQK